MHQHLRLRLFTFARALPCDPLYSRIDQSFRALIDHLLACPVYTVTSLVEYIHRFLSAYSCHECIELHCLWDWKAFFAPHVHESKTGQGVGS